MSVASIMKNDAGIEELSYREINCDVLNAVIVNATTINGGGGDESQNLESVLTVGNDGGGNSIQNVSTLGTTGRIEIINPAGNDCQVVLCPTNQGTVGLHYGLVANTSNVSIGLYGAPSNNGNVLQCNIDGSAQLCTNGVLNLYDGSRLSRVYDEYNNPPTLGDVLSAGNSANGLNMTNVGSIACSNLTTTGYLEIGNAVSNTSQLHFMYGNGTTGGDNIQLIGASNGLTAQYYHDGANPVNILNISNAGLLTCPSFSCPALANVTTINGSAYPPTLESVISASNSADGLNITDVGSMSCTNITVTNINGSTYPPTLGDVISASNSADGLNITDVGSIACSNLTTTGYLEIGNAVSNTSQLHFMYGNGTTGGDNIQLIGASNGLTAQYYHNGANPVNMLNISNAGLLTCPSISCPALANVTTINGSAYPPPAVLSKALGYANSTVDTQYVNNTGVAVQWQGRDTTQTLGTADIQLDSNKSSFQNSGSVAHLFGFSGYISFSNTGTPGSSLALWANLNSGVTPSTITRIWYDNRTIDNDFPSIPFSFNVVLQPLDFITLYAWTNSGAQISINGQQDPYTARIVVTEF